MKTSLCLGAIISAFAGFAMAQTKTYDWVEQARRGANTIKISEYLDEKSGALRRTQAGQLIKDLSAKIELANTDPKKGTTTTDKLNAEQRESLTKRTILIHTLVWKKTRLQPSTSPNLPVLGLDIDQEHWYVYTADGVTDADFETAQRLLGVRNTGFLYIHLNVPDGLTYTSHYHLSAVKKQPLYWQHLAGLLTLFGVTTDSSGTDSGAKLPTWCWNFAVIGSSDDPFPVPSDLAVKAEYRVVKWPSSDATSVPPAADTTLASSKGTKFDNEGMYYIDFSAGVPIKKIRDVMYVPSGNTLAPVDVDKQNIYAFLNIYPRPVDLKNHLGTGWLPHPLLGVKIGNQPLKQVIIGAGIGPPVANIYAGILINTRSMSATSTCKTATPAVAGETLKAKTCAEFTFGLNISVGAITKALKK